MLRIKNYMFNMDKITMIKYDEDDDSITVFYLIGNNEEYITIDEASFKDIRLEEVI